MTTLGQAKALASRLEEKGWLVPLYGEMRDGSGNYGITFLTPFGEFQGALRAAQDWCADVQVISNDED